MPRVPSVVSVNDIDPILQRFKVIAQYLSNCRFQMEINARLISEIITVHHTRPKTGFSGLHFSQRDGSNLNHFKVTGSISAQLVERMQNNGH